MLSASERLAASREHLRLAMQAQPTHAEHPAHRASAMAALAAKAALQPVAQKHPWALVGAALLIGGALAWSRPWRWAAKPLLSSALFASLLPQLWSKALPYLSALPLQSWLLAAGEMAKQSALKAPLKASSKAHQKATATAGFSTAANSPLASGSKPNGHAAAP
jgi:hypothetical protein